MQLKAMYKDKVSFFLLLLDIHRLPSRVFSESKRDSPISVSYYRPIKGETMNVLNFSLCDILIWEQFYFPLSDYFIIVHYFT